MKLLLIPFSICFVLLIVLIVMSLNDVPSSSEGQTEQVELGHSYKNGGLGLKLNDVQCLNMATGQIEICY